MIRLTTIAIVCLGLAGCTSAETERYVSLLSGTAQEQSQAFLAIPAPSEEQASSSEAPPPPPPCVPGTSFHDWRFNLYDDCTGELVGPDPKYL